MDELKPPPAPRFSVDVLRRMRRDVVDRAEVQSESVRRLLRESSTRFDPAEMSARSTAAEVVGVVECARRQSASVHRMLGELGRDDERVVALGQSLGEHYEFVSRQVDMSAEEAEWMRDNGALPFATNFSRTFDPNSFGEQSVGPDSQTSMGRYFENRCLNIDDFLKPESKRSDDTFKEVSPKDSNEKVSKCRKNGSTRNITTEDTFSTSAFSLTKIKNIMGDLKHVERPSVLIDKMLGLKHRTHNIVDDESIFHSTKHVDNLSPANYKQSSSKRDFIDSSLKISPIKDAKPAKISDFRPDINSGTSDSTLKSTATVINVKPETITLDTVKESIDRTSPRIMSANEKVSFVSDILHTPVEVKKELSELMSKSDDAVFHSPPSGRHVKRLLDHYDEVQDHGWISPSQAQTNTISKECILKSENCISPVIKSLIVNSYSPVNLTVSRDNSVPVLQNGDWIKVESACPEILAGVEQDITLNIVSQSTCWISVKFSISDVFVDGAKIEDDIKTVIIMQAPESKILIKADSDVNCVLKVVAFRYDVDLQIKLNVNMENIVTQNTLDMEHCIRMTPKLPQVHVQNREAEFMEKVLFGVIPEQCSQVIPLLLWNTSKVDLPVSLDVKSSVFSIIHVEIVFEEESIMSHIQSTCKDLGRSNLESRVYSIPRSRKAALYIMLMCSSPKLKGEELEKYDSVLNMSLISPVSNEKLLCIKSIPLEVTVGISSLLIRSSQKSKIISVSQGTSETIAMYNAGNIPMQYNLYIALQTKTLSDLVVCEDNLLVLNKSSIEMQPQQKDVVKVSFPFNEAVPESVTRMLVFQSPYNTEVVKLVGVCNSSRCSSQQSAYSVESVNSQTQGIELKATKRELSWGSLKIGESKLQDVTLKNTSTTKKLKLIISVIGEGFKAHSDTGFVSALMITFQPQECRALNVEFKPSHPGGHFGFLRIVRRCDNRQKENKTEVLHVIPLFGVGGQSTIIFTNGIFQHSRTQGLTLGSLRNSGLVKKVPFTIWNKATMPSFVSFTVNLSWRYRSLGGRVFVTPDRVILQPGAEVQCSINVPQSALHLAQCKPGDTEVVASLHVFHGDETTRLRIKKIYENFKDDVNALEDIISREKLNSICAKFPDENSKLGNVHKFKESLAALKSLLDELLEKEVIVTYDVNLDCSMGQLSTDLDETLQFHTLHDSDICDTTKID